MLSACQTLSGVASNESSQLNTAWIATAHSFTHFAWESFTQCEAAVTWPKIHAAGLTRYGSNTVRTQGTKRASTQP